MEGSLRFLAEIITVGLSILRVFVNWIFGVLDLTIKYII